MKRILLLLALVVATGVGYAQETATVHFARKKMYTGLLGELNMFIDGKPVCKVNNNSYSTHQIAPGKHTFSVQYSGDESKEKAAARSVEIDVQPGKKYILKAAIEKKFFTTELYLEEITEATWERYQKGLKEDNCL